MENKKISINNSNLANLVVGSVSNSTKLGSGGITLDPMMAKIFIGGMLTSKGINQKEIKNTLNILDSQLKDMDTKLKEKLNNKKESNDKVETDSVIVKKKDDISTKNNNYNESIESNNCL